MAQPSGLNSAQPKGPMRETRDQKRGRIFSGLIRSVDDAVGEAHGDEEMRAMLMKLFIDLQRKRKALVPMAEEET